MIGQVRPGSVSYLSIQRMAWNLNTQKRHLKHTDAPPDDCVGWDGYQTIYVGYRSHDADLERIEIDLLIRRLIERVEAEPNRWWRLALAGESGYMTSSGWVADEQMTRWKPVTVLGPFCKDKGVVPELEKGPDGLYELPVNLPDSASHQPYDPGKPMLGQAPKEKVELETTPVNPGTVIEAFDDWGEPYTFEVI